MTFPKGNPQRVACTIDMLGLKLINTRAELKREDQAALIAVLGALLDWYSPPKNSAGKTATTEEIVGSVAQEGGLEVGALFDACFYLIDSYFVSLAMALDGAGLGKKFAVKGSVDVATRVGMELLDIVEGQK